MKAWIGHPDCRSTLLAVKSSYSDIVGQVKQNTYNPNRDPYKN